MMYRKFSQHLWLAVMVLFIAALPLAWVGSATSTEIAERQSGLPGVSVQFSDRSERHLTIPELESLGVWQARATSPAGDLEGVLEGPLLRDVLAHVGADTARSILVRAADAYALDIPREDWRNLPVILATRMNGKPLGRRLMGPTQIIYPARFGTISAGSGRADRNVRLVTLIEISEH